MTSKKSSEELLEEMDKISKDLANQYIPQLCRALRDEWSREDDTEEFIALNKRSIKIRLMHDLRGEFFKDRIYDKYGRRLLPQAGGWKKNYRYPDENGGWVFIRPKELSRMAKLVEQLIDEEVNRWKENVS